MASADAQEGNASMRKRGQVAAEDDTPAHNGGGPTAESPAAAEARTQKQKRKDEGCCMRFLRSPLFKAFVLAVVAATPIFGLLVALPTLLERRECTEWFCVTRHYCIALFLAGQFMYNFVMTQWTDPGGCKKIKPTYEALGQYELTLSTEGSSGERKKLLGNGATGAESQEAKGEDEASELSMLYAPNFCGLCQHWKPPRSHHCTLCKRCVLRMDHHCYFTGNCIGAHNHGHFLLTFVFAAVGLIYVLTLCLLAILHQHSGAVNGLKTGLLGHAKKASSLDKLPSSMADLSKTVMMGIVPSLGGIVHLLLSHGHGVLAATGPVVATQTVLSLISLVVVLSFGIPAFWTASQGSTIIEINFPMKEYVQIKPTVYCPLGPGFYRQKWHQNIGQLLGTRWFLRLLLPMRGTIDPVLGISPRPSEEGVRALRERMDQVAREGAKREVRSCRDLGINPGPPSTESGAVV